MKSTAHPSSVAPLAFFAGSDGDGPLVPLPHSSSGWGPEQLQGPAITGLLTRAAGRLAAELRPELRAARISFDLFRTVRLAPTEVKTAVIRNGRRFLLVDAHLAQGGEERARAHAVFLAPSENPSGATWSRSEDLRVPDSATPANPFGRLFAHGNAAWTADASADTSADRKFVWQRPLRIVEGDTPTPLDLLGCAADVASLAVHWGSHGVQYINVEVTVTFSRLPTLDGIGLASDAHVADDGISVGTAVLYDRLGRLGTATVTAVAQAEAARAELGV